MPCISFPLPPWLIVLRIYPFHIYYYTDLSVFYKYFFKKIRFYPYM
nr:MAG TPA: hypothetical protein [Caudoviricetes sp.]